MGMNKKRGKQAAVLALSAGLFVGGVLGGGTFFSADAQTVAQTPQIGDTLKFDFGDPGEVADGWIGVDEDRTYFEDGATGLNTDGETGYTYGFLGIGEKGYLASDRPDGDRTDGYIMDPGMEITLHNAGSGKQPADDYVYADRTISYEGAEVNDAYDMGDGSMPVRFALNVEEDSYYTIHATVANASTKEEAEVNLYSERRHQIVTGLKLAPGETKEITFNAAVTNVYFQKSDPKGLYKDTQLNIAVAGKNAALAALEVTRIEHSPVIFLCGDSTGCDQSGYVPSYPLQNYTGVGQGITAYFQDVMLSNQGEGGLAANDSLHFNSAVAQLKEGDYLYVEYGHNHKTDGVAGYVKCLKKYYEAAHKAGAKLIVVGPIDRRMQTQYQAASNSWSSTLGDYSIAGEGYVKALIYGGLTKAEEYAAAWAGGKSAAQAYLEDLEKEGITDGVTDAAFIDLNERWLSFLESVTAGNDTVGKNNYSLAAFYYTCDKIYGANDLTHINDHGANNAGYIFASEVKRVYEEGAEAQEDTVEYVQAQVLEDLYRDYMDHRSETQPDRVPDEILAAGGAPNAFYPDKFNAGAVAAYPAQITDVRKDYGIFTTVDVEIIDNMKSYGKVRLDLFDESGKQIDSVWTTDWLDNTAMKPGAFATLHFELGSAVLPEKGSYVARVYPVDDIEGLYDGNARAMSGEFSGNLSNEVPTGDLALQKPVTASKEASGHPGSYLVDGDETTVWSPGGDATANIIVDLKKSYPIGKIELATYDWYGLAYKVELSENGTDYELFYENPTASGKTQMQDVIEPEQSMKGRYVKLSLQKPDDRNWIGLADLKVYADENAQGQKEEPTTLQMHIAEVIGKILEVGNVTWESGEKVRTAQEAYDKLTKEEKEALPASASDKLTEIKTAYAAAKAEKEEADKKAQQGKEEQKPQPSKQPEQKVPAKGTVQTVGDLVYIVTVSDASAPEVAVKQSADKAAKKITVPATVVINGCTCKVTAIADNALKGNKKLTDIKMTGEITSIGKNAFAGCTALKSITIPEKVTRIGANAFKGDKKLKKITVKSAVLKTVGKNALKGIYKKAVIKVPKKLKKSYAKLFGKKGQNPSVKVR